MLTDYPPGVTFFLRDSVSRRFLDKHDHFTCMSPKNTAVKSFETAVAAKAAITALALSPDNVRVIFFVSADNKISE